MYHKAEMEHLQFGSSTTRSNKSTEWNLQAIMTIEISQMISSFHFEPSTLAVNVGAIYDQVG